MTTHRDLPDAGRLPRRTIERRLPTDHEKDTLRILSAGTPATVAGAPGSGKSLVALDLARRIIQAEPFPDGAPAPFPGDRVLIVDAEGVPALLTQRAGAWDIDLRRLFLMVPPDFGSAKRLQNLRYGNEPHARLVRPSGQAEPGALIDLARPDQRHQLWEMVEDLRPALVIVDLGNSLHDPHKR